MSTDTDRRELTEHELSAANRVRNCWLTKKKDLLLTQDLAAERMKMSQSVFNRYLNAKLPLNLEAVFKFSQLLGEAAENLAPEIVAPYAQQIQGVERALIVLSPDQKEKRIQSLQKKLEAAIAGKPPLELSEEDGKNWRRIIQAIGKLDCSDLEYFADIIEHRLTLQNGSNTGLVNDAGVVGNDTPTGRVDLAEKLR